MVKLVNLNYKDHVKSISSNVSFIRLSPFNEFLCVGQTTGEIYLYDSFSSPATNTGLIPTSNKAAVVEIQFGLDNVS